MIAADLKLGYTMRRKQKSEMVTLCLFIVSHKIRDDGLAHHFVYENRKLFHGQRVP